jgi:hypothetical protein
MGYVMKKITGYRDRIIKNGMGGDDKSPQYLPLKAIGDAAPFGLPGRFNQGQGEMGKTFKNGPFIFG